MSVHFGSVEGISTGQIFKNRRDLRYSLYIDPDNYEIKGLQLFENKKIFKHQKHNIDSQFLRYHFEQYKKRN